MYSMLHVFWISKAKLFVLIYLVVRMYRYSEQELWYENVPSKPFVSLLLSLLKELLVSVRTSIVKYKFNNLVFFQLLFWGGKIAALQSRRRFFFACREMGFSFHVFLFFSYSISSSKLDFRMIRLKDIAQVKKIKAIIKDSSWETFHESLFGNWSVDCCHDFSFLENFQRSLKWRSPWHYAPETFKMWS